MKRSANTWTRKVFTRGTQNWQGPNLSGGEFSGETTLEGLPFGTGTFGGIGHFGKLKSQ